MIPSGTNHGNHVSASEDVARMPRPRTPAADRPRKLLPRSEATPSIDVDALLGDLVAVAVGARREGLWEEDASLLLQTSDECWHLVPFTDPAATEVTARLGGLPGFDESKLLELLGSRAPRLVVLWRKSTTRDPGGERYRADDNIVLGYD